MNVGEFFVTLGVDGAAGSATLGGFVKQMGALKLTTVTAVGALAEIGKVWAGAIRTSDDAAINLRQFNAETGLSIQQLQKWQAVARIAGVSTDAIATSVTNLSENLAMMRITGQGIMPYQILGIDPRQSAWGVIKDLRKRYQTMSHPMVMALAKQMGLSSDFATIFSLSEAQFSKFTTEGMKAGLTPDEYAKSLQRVEEEKKLGATFRGFLNSLASISTGPLISLFEAMTRVLDAMNTPLQSGSAGEALYKMTGIRDPGFLRGQAGQTGSSVAGTATKGAILGGAAGLGLTAAEIAAGGAVAAPLLPFLVSAAVFGSLAAIHQAEVNKGAGGPTVNINANIHHGAGEDNYDVGYATGAAHGAAGLRAANAVHSSPYKR